MSDVSTGQLELHVTTFGIEHFSAKGDEGVVERLYEQWVMKQKVMEEKSDALRKAGPQMTPPPPTRGPRPVLPFQCTPPEIREGS